VRIGVIGTGNMGTILAEALIEGKAAKQEQIHVSNRTRKKAERLRESYPLIRVEDRPADVIAKCDVIFIAIKPHDFPRFLKENRKYFTKDKCAVSITSPVTPEQLEKALPCSCIRAIPSITNRALSGCCLITAGTNCSKEWEEKIYELLSHIGIPVAIRQEWTRVASDIVSCGPAFFSYILQQFIEAAAEKTGIEREIASLLAAEMFVGMGNLLEKNYYSLASLQEKVTVKGGITGEGIRVLEEANLQELFGKVFTATADKFREDVKGIEKAFENP